QAEGEAALATQLQLELQRHVAVLNALLGEAPGAATDAIQNAIDRSDHAIQLIDQGGGPSNPAGNGGGNGTGAGNGNGPDGSPATGGTPSQKPDHSQGPAPTKGAGPSSAPTAR